MKKIFESEYLITRYIQHNSFSLSSFFVALFFFSKKFFRLTQLTQLYENVTINFDEKIHWEQDILNFLHSEKNLCDYPFYHMLQECSDNYSKFQLFLKK